MAPSNVNLWDGQGCPEAEIAQARQSLKQGKGISIEELRAKYTD